MSITDEIFAQLQSDFGIGMKLAEASLMGIYGEKKCGNFRKVFRKSLQKILQKSFKGKFFGKFYRKFYGEILQKKVLRGKWGIRFGLRLGKLLIRHSSSEGHRFTSFSRFT